MKAILTGAVIALALSLAGCQRDDEIQMEKTFAGCKLDATKAVATDFDHMPQVISLRSNFVEDCMDAAGYERTACAEAHLIYRNDPELCFDNGSHLVATKFQDPNRKLYWELKWLRWKVGL